MTPLNAPTGAFNVSKMCPVKFSIEAKFPVAELFADTKKIKNTSYSNTDTLLVSFSSTYETVYDRYWSETIITAIIWI